MNIKNRLSLVGVASSGLISGCEVLFDFTNIHTQLFRHFENNIFFAPSKRSVTASPPPNSRNLPAITFSAEYPARKAPTVVTLNAGGFFHHASRISPHRR
ncbi:hypothetical protein KCP75_24795 [Salmonella enterica subsp. enterica]|nr:hypothetical protein KCP75_24795 [Salmonella enterica subsp. enterica]